MLKHTLVATALTFALAGAAYAATPAPKEQATTAKPADAKKDAKHEKKAEQKPAATPAPKK